MEDLCKKGFAVLSVLAVLSTPALAWESHSTWAPRFKKTLYTAKFEWKRSMLTFKLGTVDRADEPGRSRVMAVITSPKGVQGVCERVLEKGGAASLDSIPMTCSGSMFDPMSNAPVTFVISNALAHPVLRLGSAELAAR